MVGIARDIFFPHREVPIEKPLLELPWSTSEHTHRRLDVYHAFSHRFLYHGQSRRCFCVLIMDKNGPVFIMDDFYAPVEIAIGNGGSG